MILRTSELCKGDVVCYYRKNLQERGAFCDMLVARIEGNDLYLHRPYINGAGELAYEELYWHKEANFQFMLVRRD